MCIETNLFTYSVFNFRLYFSIIHYIIIYYYLPCGPITEDENTVLDLLLLFVLPEIFFKNLLEPH